MHVFSCVYVLYL